MAIHHDKMAYGKLAPTSQNLSENEIFSMLEKLNQPQNNLIDLHIHTKFSQDSKEELENYIVEAIKNGHQFIGFSDHYDYDYIFAHGELTVERIFSHSRRKTVAKVAVKAASEIAPLLGTAAPRAARLLDMRASLSAAGNYYIRYRDEDGRDAVLLFETNAKVVKAMAKYNPATVVGEGLPV